MGHGPSHYARASLFYLAGYLLPTGAGLIVLPDQVTRLLGSTGEYGTILPRAFGLMLVGIGIIVVQLIRHEVAVLYSTTVAVRSVFLAGFAWLYWMSRDRFFLVVFCVVAMGVVLTSAGLIADRMRIARRGYRRRP